MRLFDPDHTWDQAPEPKRATPRKKLPRCRCGCGKAAQWPHDGNPLFYSRLCGYLMAVKMFRRKAR